MLDKIPGRVLVFTYRTLSRFFHAVCDSVFEGPSTFCSTWPGLETVNLQKAFYKHYADRAVNYDLSEADYFEIMARSSVLRLLPWEQARRIIDAMYRTIDELTDAARPDYLLSTSVDNYPTDILARICRKKQVKLIMFCAGNTPNTIIVTNYGEFNKVREPGDAEIDGAVATYLNDAGRVTYGMKVRPHSFARQFRVFCNWWAKHFFFKAAAFLLRDPLNIRFLHAALSEYDGQSSLWGYRCVRYFDYDWEDRLARATLPALFIPLSHTPEMTTNMWLKDLRYLEYEDFIIDAARRLSKSYQVVIKEHWTMLGARRWQFHQHLKSIPGVIVVPAEVNSRKVMAGIDRMLVGSGTAALEAALRGKRVVTLDKPYYFLEGSYLCLGRAERIQILPQLLEQFTPTPSTPESRRHLVRRMLQATLVGHFLPDAQLNTTENHTTVTNSLKQYLLSSMQAGSVKE